MNHISCQGLRWRVSDTILIFYEMYAENEYLHRGFFPARVMVSRIMIPTRKFYLIRDPCSALSSKKHPRKGISRYTPSAYLYMNPCQGRPLNRSATKSFARNGCL